MKRVVHIVITLVAAVFLVWFIVPTVTYGIRNHGTVLGILLCLALIFRFGFPKYYDKLKALMLTNGFGKLIMRIIQIGASAFLIYAIIVSGFMVYAMVKKPSQNSTAVVLGAQVKPWGASAMLQQRIDAAESYLRENPQAVAVVTGGKGSDEHISEAQCMYDNLTEAGIESERVIMEDQATNTDENIRYSLSVIREKSLNRELAIVTDSYHQLRARIILHKADKKINAGAVNSRTNHVGIIAYPTFFVREWIAIPVEIIKQL